MTANDNNDEFILPLGTQVVTLRDVIAQNDRTLHPRGAVGVVVKSPSDLEHAYRVRFPDGYEEPLKPAELTTLAKFKAGEIGRLKADGKTVKYTDPGSASSFNLHPSAPALRPFFVCVIGSQAYGLTDESSDVDRRGCYLAPAELHWSLYGVPKQLEVDETQESYWEIQKFLVLALKANPNVLECLYSPIVERRTPLADELLDMRSIFLSRLVYQTYNGYVMSQFKKMQADIRNQGQVKWKHVMHLIRLLISGISALQEGFIPVRVVEHREQLLAIKRGEMAWEETESWRLSLHKEFDQALNQTKLPERPDYEQANAFLIKARRSAVAEMES